MAPLTNPNHMVHLLFLSFAWGSRQEESCESICLKERGKLRLEKRTDVAAGYCPYLNLGVGPSEQEGEWALKSLGKEKGMV